MDLITMNIIFCFSVCFTDDCCWICLLCVEFSIYFSSTHCNFEVGWWKYFSKCPQILIFRCCYLVLYWPHKKDIQKADFKVWNWASLIINICTWLGGWHIWYNFVTRMDLFSEQCTLVQVKSLGFCVAAEVLIMKIYLLGSQQDTDDPESRQVLWEQKYHYNFWKADLVNS